MRAAVIREHGGVDVLRVEEVPEPKPAADEVLVKVLCAGLNHLDIWVRKGRPGAKFQMPHVMGSDAVGVVEAVGAEVTHVKAGDEVVIYPGLSCGHCGACARGERSLCASFGIVGFQRPGTFAEKVAVPAYCVYPRPVHLSPEEAGGFVLAYLTAWRMLMTRAEVRPGDCVLIHGIGGGVAICALQLAKQAGAEVIVTSSSDEKLSRARELGADHTINYRKEDVAGHAREITGSSGVDVVIDAVGAATWPIDLSVVHKGGKVVLCGITTGAIAETNLQAVYWNQLTLMGSTLGSMDDLRRMVKAVEVGNLRPVVDEVFPLKKVQEATQKMEDARQLGKIVLKVSD
ncbi:MAG: zinc-binding dehydrogenase [Sedimentisphaerales bacterium]|nr:zinc-binding dehydrogenase [Sedimentisphaerales bacterium]